MSLPNPQIDRQALEQLRESHPELESVHEITALKEEEFIQTYARAFAGDVQQARRVYQLAETIQQHTALLWANLKDIASPFIQNTTFNTIPASFLEHQQAIPGYDRLFGNLDYVECEPCRSVFGPAAYFVDLMRFVETFITERNLGIPAEQQLEYRRPDLFNLKLDCANTSDLIAYIDLVNETLETIVATPAQPDATQVLNDARFPSNLPYNRPLEEIRSYLSQVKLRLSEVYQTFETSPPSKVTAISRETLNLSPAEFEIIRTELIASVDLREHYGLNETQTLASLATISTFLEKTGLSRQELNDLLFQDLDQYEAHQLRLPRLFFINQAEDGLDYLQIKEGESEPNSFYRVPQEQFVNLSAAKLDRMFRFVKLARKLSWSFADLDWALRSLQSNSEPERGLYFDGINDYVTVETGTKLDLPSFTIEAWIQPTQSKTNPILYKGETLTVDDPRIHVLFGLDGDNQLVLHTQHYHISGTTAIPIGKFTHVAVSLSESQVLMYINGKPEPLTEATITPVTPVGTTLNIGADLGYEFFAGSLKEVRIWQGVRSEATIAANRYRRFTGQERGLVAYWTLIEDASNPLSDRTPNPNHGSWGGAGTTSQPIWVPQELLLDPLPLPLEESAFDFNGIDQYLGTENIRGLQIDTSTGHELTLEAWIMPRLNQSNPIVRIGSGSFRNNLRRQPQLELGLTPEGTLVIAIGTTVMDAGNPAIALNQFTHVAVTISTGHIQFYVNGQVATSIPLSTPLTVNGTELEIGRNLSNHYFAGQIRDVRLWDQVRTAEQIQQTMNQVLPPRAAGLIGYWQLNQAAETAQDSSFNQNHLWLGGIPEEFRPDRIILPADSGFLHYPLLPVVTTGTVLELDGINDVIVISNPQNAGLGQYRQLTLELWFRPTNLEQRSAQRQVIYSQGDRKAGLSAYLFENQVYVVTWCEDDSQQIQETVLRSAPLVSNPAVEGPWHHLAITHDETRSLNWVEFRSYMDAAPLEFVASSHANNATLSDEQKGYPLKSTEFAYLGGIAEPGIARFQGEFSTRSQHNFAGQIIDLRLWKRVKTAAEIGTERYAAPDLTHPDLVAYLPMSEGNGEVIRDRTQSGYEGTLTRHNQMGDRPPLFRLLQLEGQMVFGTDASLDNLSAIYTSPNTATTVMPLSNYTVTGRMRLSDTQGGIGVTILDHTSAGVRQSYSLRYAPDSSFRLVAETEGALFELSGSPQRPTNSRIVPLVNTWYAFRLVVDDRSTENRTRLRARVWQDGTAEPDNFQMEAFDSRESRLRSGSVGVWTTGTGAKYFDSFKVFPLNENFGRYQDNENPSNWQSTASGYSRTVDADLFKTSVQENNTIFRTTSRAADIHSHYTASDALNWSNYLYSGRLSFTQPNASLGVTFFSRYPDTQAIENTFDRYYRLERGTIGGSGSVQFQLIARRNGVSTIPLQGTLNTTLTLPPNTTPHNTWYRFQIEVQDTGDRTQIRAKVWVSGTPEPRDYQMNAFDDASDRLKAGTVGLWSRGNGEKRFDDLKVQWIESITASPFVNYWQPTIRQSELDNPARWSIDQHYPLLLRPLDRQALEFVRSRRSLTINNPTGLNFNQFTIATWALWALRNRVGDRPIFSWQNKTTGESFWFGITTIGRLTLVRVDADNSVEQVESIATLGNGQFAYLAVTVNEGIVTFYIDGEPDTPIPFPSAILFNPVSLDVGRFSGNAFSEFMLDLRLWSTALSLAQFAPDLRYQKPDPTAADLAGYWAFDEPDGALAFDSSVNANHLRLGGMEGARRPNFVGTPSLSPPIKSSPVTLDASTLTQIATIRQLQERHNHLAIDRLTALWFQIQHTGREDGQTLFDRVFNGRGITGETWDYAQSPLRWNSAGQNRPDREIRSRLMGSLQLSSEDLDRLVRWISNPTPVIELDSQTLNRLYRLSQIPKVLRLTVQDFLRLLTLMQLTDVNTLEGFKQVSDRADWLKRTGIQVSELEFLTGSTSSSPIPRPYSNAAIRDLATALTNQSREFLATSRSFVSDLVNLTQSMQIFESLRAIDILNAQGSVTHQYQAPINLAQLNGLPSDPAVLQAIQTQVEGTLSQMQQEHANAVVERLAELFQVEPERLRIVADRLNVTPSLFLNWMQQVVDAADRGEFPTDLTNRLIPYLDQLTKGLYLITRFALTTAEATDLLQNPDHFSVTNVFEPAIADLEHLVMFTELKTAFNDVDGGLIRVFNQTTDLTISEAILDVTHWDSVQLATLTHYFENQSTANRIPELHRLYRAFALAETLQVDVEFLIQLANTNTLNLEFYRQQSNAVLNVVRSRYDDEQWQRVYKPLRDSLATQRRDALLSYALSRQLPDTFQGRRDADVLYEYLLLDVQIGSEVETSRIVQGTAALQLYVQRCLLNLEQGVNPATIPLDQWNWMKNYRVWEANRKVFLYPESYIEPELRDTKTPLFEELEQELMQGEINPVNIEQAFNSYLNKLAELADLKIVGAYLHREAEELFRIQATPLLLSSLEQSNHLSPEIVQAFRDNGIPNANTARLVGNNQAWTLTIQDRSYTLRRSGNTLIVYTASSNSSVLYLIGRTATQPSQYYYREMIVDESRWLPWKKIDLALDAEFVTPVFAFNRLFLFWVEFTEISRQNRSLYRPTIRYSYRDLNQGWITPQLYEERAVELEENQRSRPVWQQVYALRTSFSIPSVADQRERLLVIYGDTNGAAEIPVRTLRNAREHEAFTLRFLNQGRSQTNGLDVGLSLRHLGGTSLTLGYMTLALVPILNQIADGVRDTDAIASLQRVLNNLFGRPSGVGQLTTSQTLRVENQGENQWFVSEDSEEFQIRQESGVLNVYRTSGQHLGNLTEDPWINVLNALNEQRPGSTQTHGVLQGVLNDLFNRPPGVERLNLSSNFRVVSLNNNQWRLIHNPHNLMVLQEGTRLNVYDFSPEALNLGLRALSGGFLGIGVNLSLPFNLENRGNNRWMITDSNNQRYLLQREQDAFQVYEFSQAFLYLTQTQDASINDFILAQEPVRASQSDFQNNSLLRALPPESSLIDVNGQRGLYVLDTGEEQFLVSAALNLFAPDQPQFVSDVPNSMFSFTLVPDPVLLDRNVLQTRFRFERLDTSAIRELSFRLFAEGIDGLLNLRSQQRLERNFSSYLPNTNRVISGDAPNENISFDGAFGLYYQELFFHIPFFIANQLNANQNFAEAQRWYHYIFNPTSQESVNGTAPGCSTTDGYLAVLPNRDRYWQYLPFRNLCVDSITRILDNQAALAAYRNDPFDPHAIAQLRINAYQKAIVMKYIDNLLDWGDTLFSQNNRESIGDATQLYILAFNLLGSRPEGRANRRFEEIGDYNAIRQVFNNPPDFLTNFTSNGSSENGTSSNRALPVPQNGNILTTFCVTENADFVSFWDRVSDRLFKIRHSLTIEGIFRQLDLFQPPLDVRALVAAFASGNRDISSILADINRPVPHYRYGYMLDKAKGMTEIVIGLGEKLLEAIQNRDVEQLATLQNTHERNILELTTSVKRLARDEAEESLAALQISRDNLQNRFDYFTNLITGGEEEATLSLSQEEATELVLTGTAQIVKTGIVAPFQLVAAYTKSTSTVINGISGIEPVAELAITGDSLAAFADGVIAVGETIADVLTTAAELTGKIGEYKRRLEEWQFEQRTTELDLQEIDRQIEVAHIQLRMAERELAIHDRTIQQNQEVADFYRRKFTNEQLYNWMISRISGLYFQAYKLAYATAKDTERAFQYEFGDNSQFINFGHWDSLRRGLLAGESLQLDLMRLEKYAIDQDSRYQEIEKIISLRSALPEAFEMLRNSGSCFFNLTERMFDEDYPGHFFRIIKSIAITVQSPALTPNQSLNATLIQLNNRALLEPDIDAVRYLMGVEGINQPNATVVRSNWRANQQIAVSRPNRDNGMFGDFDSLLLFDDRYFPFEGTGAVSSWELEMPQAPQFLAANASDILIHLKYTSRSDRGAFRRSVQEELRRS